MFVFRETCYNGIFLQSDLELQTCLITRRLQGESQTILQLRVFCVQVFMTPFFETTPHISSSESPNICLLLSSALLSLTTQYKKLSPPLLLNLQRYLCKVDTLTPHCSIVVIKRFQAALHSRSLALLRGAPWNLLPSHQWEDVFFLAQRSLLDRKEYFRKGWDCSVFLSQINFLIYFKCMNMYWNLRAQTERV